MIPTQMDHDLQAESQRGEDAPPTNPMHARDLQAADFAQRKPKQRAQDLAAIERINRQHIEDQQAEIDPPQPYHEHDRDRAIH